MAQSGKVLSPGFSDRFKFEIAEELGIPLQKGYNGDITAREAGQIGGRIGGNMVKVMIRHAQEALKQGSQ